MNRIIVLFFCLLSTGYKQLKAQDEEKGIQCKEFVQFNTKQLSGDTLISFGQSCVSYFGESNFSNRVFKGRANFTNAIFAPESKFNKTIFEGSVLFRDARFLSQVSFNEMTTHRIAGFQRAQFYNKADFSASRFDSVGNFYYAEFYSLADFRNSEFNEQANFLGAGFQDCDFSNSKLGNRCYFMLAEFDGHVRFNKSAMGEIVTFKNARFGSSADFSDARMGQWNDFTGATFSKEVIFDRANLPDTLLLINVNSAEVLDFTGCDYKEHDEIVVDFFKTDLAKVKFNYRYFHLFFYESYQITDAEKLKAFELLLQHQSRLGFKDGYEKADKEYQEFKLINQNRYMENWFQKYWLGYGYHTGWLIARNLLLLIGLILLVRYGIISIRKNRPNSKGVVSFR